MGKSDPDVMTVSPGISDALLFTFAAGITTDIDAVDADGLRAELKGSSKVTLAAQPAHIDHSTGSLSGTVTGSGTLGGDGSCDIMLHFVSDDMSTTQDYEVSGSKE